MATLNQVHKIEAEMLSSIDDFCNSNGIRYTMIGGTMLGAIRHKGFIPWDDDIDIAMNMDDFEVLKREYRSDKYFLQTPESDIQMPFIMCKLRCKKTFMPEPQMESLDMHQGIWIDIFLYTNAGKTKSNTDFQLFLFKVLQSYRCRYLNRNLYPAKKAHALLTKLPRSTQIVIDHMIVSIIKRLGNENAAEYFMLDAGKYRVYPKRYLDNLRRYEFEGHTFLGVEDFESFLTWVYGNDYMTPRKWQHLPDCSGVIINMEDVN